LGWDRWKPFTTNGWTTSSKSFSLEDNEKRKIEVKEAEESNDRLI
jgi:hypothetical protein